MMIWSWALGPDILVDFGQELYHPWQIAHGKILYTQLEYEYGPLSPYFNAMLFAIFGVSLRCLVIANAAILALILILCYRLLDEMAGRLSAILGCLTFVMVCAFGQFVTYGNYNFICPYSHAITHGVLFCFIAITLFGRFLRTGLTTGLLWVGLAVGAVFLTKPELFVAVACSIAGGLALTIWIDRLPLSRMAAMSGAFILGGLIPPATALMLLSRVMPWRMALRGALGAFWFMFRASFVTMPFFAHSAGVDHVWLNLGLILLWLGRYALAFAPAAIIALALRRPKTGNFVALAVGVLWLGLAIVFLYRIPWLDAARPLPAFMLIAGSLSFALLLRHRQDHQASHQLILRLVFIAFALLMLLKIILYARLRHFGFALALPAALVLVAVMTDWIPAAIRAHGGYARVFLAAWLAIWSVEMTVHLMETANFFATKTHWVGRGADAIRTDDRGLAVQEILGQIAMQVKPDQTLAVFPAGVMINYLSRRANSSPMLIADPGPMALFGEDQLLASYQSQPPDFIAIVPGELAEFGYRGFGIDYALKITRWIQANYVLISRPRPGNDQILLLKRASPATNQSRAKSSLIPLAGVPKG